MFALTQSKQTRMIMGQQQLVSVGTSGFCVMVMRRELAAKNLGGWQRHEMQNLRLSNETSIIQQRLPNILLL
jgi:hypothetical protein